MLSRRSLVNFYQKQSVCCCFVAGNNLLDSLWFKKKKKKRWKTCFRITLLVPPVNGAVGLSFISFRALWPCLPSVHSATTVLFSFASPLDLPLCLLVIQRWKQWKLINRDTQSQKLFQLYCCADTLHLLLDTSTLDFYSSTHSLLTEQHKQTHK